MAHISAGAVNFPAERREDGELLVGGLRSSALAQRFGTPLLVLDYDRLDDAIETFVDACTPHHMEIAYAAKALLLVDIARHLKATPVHLDVCSIGELETAERAGFPAARMDLHGCGKTGAELDAAVTGRVGRVIVDNLEELRALAQRSRGRAVPLLLRVNTGIAAHTHEYVHTSGQASKFGLDSDALDPALDIVRAADGLRFSGLHSHIGSQIYEPEAFAANARALIERAAHCQTRGFSVESIVVGGGFGVQMGARREAIDVRATMDAIAGAVALEAQHRRTPVPRVGIEPGRALIAQAGTSLYTVVSVKRQFGRPYVIVDGGVYENPRPALYDAYHHIVSASATTGDCVETVVCGRTCENDRLGTAMLPATVRAGDRIAMQTTGAYTYSMASNYNRFSRPAVIAVHGANASLVARRETTDDVLRSDSDD